MDKKEITLAHPIEANGETVHVLTLARPRVKHLKAMDEATGDVEKAAMLIGALAGIPPASVDQMDAEDFAKASEAVADFFGGQFPGGGN